MKTIVAMSVVCFALFSCNGEHRSAALPDNVKEDRPIVLKEGQAVILVPESNKSLMIGVSVAGGKLSIAEINLQGRNFGITWNDQESWSTSTIFSSDSERVAILDHDGDGIPDFKVVRQEDGYRRFEVDEIRWREIIKKKPRSE